MFLNWHRSATVDIHTAAAPVIIERFSSSDSPPTDQTSSVLTMNSALADNWGLLKVVQLGWALLWPVPYCWSNHSPKYPNWPPIPWNVPINSKWKLNIDQFCGERHQIPNTRRLNCSNEANQANDQNANQSLQCRKYQLIWINSTGRLLEFSISTASAR